MECMHYYGYKWDQIMAVPVKLFWTLLGNMYRLKSAENLRWVQLLSMPNSTEEFRQEFIHAQISRIGVVHVSDERDPEGLNKLKNLQ